MRSVTFTPNDEQIDECITKLIGLDGNADVDALPVTVVSNARSSVSYYKLALVLGIVY